MLVVCPCKYRQQHINSNNINKDDNNIDINFHIAILLCTTVGWTHATFAFFCHLRGKNLQNFTHLVGQIWKYLCFDANLGSRGNKNYEKIWNTYMVQIHGSLTRGRCRLAAIVGWVFFLWMKENSNYQNKSRWGNSQNSIFYPIQADGRCTGGALSNWCTGVFLVVHCTHDANVRYAW